jgi:putrescine aminotransferase
MKYPDCDVFCARSIENAVQFEDPSQISALIGEPIQQGFGAFAPPKEYWTIVRSICDRYGILLILDEVISGFGRTGEWFGVQHFRIQPDMIVMAKGITSGYVPLGGVGFSDDIMDGIDTFQHLHTYANHPVSCAAALKNIEILKQEKLIENSREMGNYLLEKLGPVAEHPTVGEIRGKGLWIAIDLTSDKNTRADLPAEAISRIVGRAWKKQLIIKSTGQAIKLAPPLTIRKNEIDEAVSIIEECIGEEEKQIGRR